AAIGLLDHHWDELVLVGIVRISHVPSFGPADRHQRKFARGTAHQQLSMSALGHKQTFAVQ
ncbi:MAG: hypothetical protein WBW28_13150, partial [Pseudolabrys sp.]